MDDKDEQILSKSFYRSIYREKNSINALIQRVDSMKTPGNYGLIFPHKGVSWKVSLQHSSTNSGTRRRNDEETEEIHGAQGMSGWGGSPP